VREAMVGLAMEEITKYYAVSDTLANDKARLRVGPGEIHALVGENGAGKTTLMRVLYGLEKPDSGRIILDGKEVRIANPAWASKLGIGMVHQHFMTVDDFTVAENVVLGAEPRWGGLLYDAKEAERAVRATMDRHGFSLDPARPASSLSVGERQQLEIVKLLHRNARILILDEPTAVLTEQEIRALFDTLRILRASGHTIVVITHKVKEVKEISDSVTVMRAGRTVDSFRTAEIGEYDLSCLMMGTASCSDFSRTASPAYRPEPVLAMKGVGLSSRAKGVKALDGVDLHVNRGEVLGVCGVSGNGVSELEDVLGGFRKPSSGRIDLCGSPLPRRRLPATSGKGVGYVPADRIRRGAGTALSVTENFIALDRCAFFPHGLLDSKAAFAATQNSIGHFSIKGSATQAAGELSGGNIQKVILARELSDPPPLLLIFSEPTWGLDIASTEFVYRKILEARDKGSGILLLSSNLDEILELSDRVSVMYRGRIVCDLPNDGGLTRERLGEYMLGLADDSADTGNAGNAGNIGNARNAGTPGGAEAGKEAIHG
ncbi:MAG: ABC transporter ATP-binding protein, partial [Rectinemataceae bacterium]